MRPLLAHAGRPRRGSEAFGWWSGSSWNGSEWMLARGNSCNMCTVCNLCKFFSFWQVLYLTWHQMYPCIASERKDNAKRFNQGTVSTNPLEYVKWSAVYKCEIFYMCLSYCSLHGWRGLEFKMALQSTAQWEVLGVQRRCRNKGWYTAVPWLLCQA